MNSQQEDKNFNNNVMSWDHQDILDPMVVQWAKKKKNYNPTRNIRTEETYMLGDLGSKIPCDAYKMELVFSSLSLE